MRQTPYSVLFLCTHNSARSIMAEAILTKLSHGRFAVYSAGSQPSGEINPYVLDLLKRLQYPTDTLRSKDWSLYAQEGAPQFDFVFTVCDTLAGEPCPVWHGQPMVAHWGFADPSTASGTEAEKAAFVADIYRQIERRLAIFANLPLASLDRLALQQRLTNMSHRSNEPEASVA
jgi:arsenate reductase (thioredoxin)